MGLRISTNIQALSAQRNLRRNSDKQAAALEKLSSGNRINKSADDAAGLAISEKLKGSIRSMTQATRNANDGVSLIQVAEGAMSEVGNILIRLRELSIQSASDTISNTERSFVDKEVQQLKTEIQRISDSTEFNGTKLLNGSSEQLEIQIGINNSPTLDRLVFDSPGQVTTLENLGIGDITASTKESSQENLGMIDSAMTKLSSSRASLGALQNRLNSTVNNLTVYSENLSAANSRVRDTDIAEESTNLTKQNILSQSNVAVLAQANASAQLALKLL